MKSRKKFLARVIKGAGRGKKLGFPTINLTSYSSLDLTPGIYVCRTFINTSTYWGLLFFGPRPVFNEDELSLEAHLLDFKENFKIPKEIKVEIHQYIRPVKDFATIEELIEKMKDDVKRAREYIAQFTSR